MARSWSIWAWSCGVLLLAACATAPPRPSVGLPWPQSRAHLQSLERFTLKGRVGVAAGNEGFSAGLEWQQQGARSELALNGPLGVGGVRIDAEGEQLRVRNSRGQVLDSDAARQELEQRLGFDPPLMSLRYWVLGVPDPATPATETLGSDQRLAALEQDGWHISYGAYTASGSEQLPQRITLQRGNVRVKLVVSQWQA